MSWDLGQYEQLAARLEPAARIAVDRLAPVPGEFVVDVGCGTGNAALLVAEAGADVRGVDPAPRLLDVARSTAAARGLRVEYRRGDASALAISDASVDAVVSVFGLIFAPDAPSAARELDRVLRESARIVLTAWMPIGVLGEQSKRRRELLAEVRGADHASAFAWHDRSALEELLGPYRFVVETEEAALAFTGSNAVDYCDEELRCSPVWVEARSVLEPAGRWAELRESTERAFIAANEDPGGFRVTSRFVVAVARRSAEGAR